MKDACNLSGKAMELSNTTQRDRAVHTGDEGKGADSGKFHKRLSQKEERVEELLRKLDVKLRKADRTLL